MKPAAASHAASPRESHRRVALDHIEAPAALILRIRSLPARDFRACHQPQSALASVPHRQYAMTKSDLVRANKALHAADSRFG